RPAENGRRILAVPIAVYRYRNLVGSGDIEARTACHVDGFMLELHQEIPLAVVDAPYLNDACLAAVDGDPVPRVAVDAPIRGGIPGDITARSIGRHRKSA